MNQGFSLRGVALIFGLLTIITPSITADDWPEFRGQGRNGVWAETGILETFPEGGLDIRWRTPINRGFSGPAVAAGREVGPRAQRALRAPGAVGPDWCRSYQYLPALKHLIRSA